MISSKDMFEFTKSGQIIAFIQATSKKQARRRTQLVSHIVRIPERCKVRAVEKGTLCRAPIFFDKHLRALEDAIEDALAEA
ncbi:hypothetical protein BN2497_3825 [Janthinobacterium sp. CG23_2]|nr:hypothetical protein BN2497_3825 [Janthinobacterium sp. CG23_2]CUU28310.1 hypothetical protein BN3177_3825 [Janthinobacterium sp. CG23_2]